MEVFSFMSGAQEAYEEYYTQAVNFLRDKIEAHFEGDNWTNEHLEELYGKTLYSAEGIDDVTYNEYSAPDSGMIDVSSALRKENIQEELDTREDITELIGLAEKMKIDFTGLNEPYKLIILRDSEDIIIEDWDTADDLLSNEAEIGDNLEKIIVCQNREDLIKAWELYLNDYEGCWYGVTSSDYGIIVGGAYDPGDIDYILDSTKSYNRDVDDDLIRETYNTIQPKMTTEDKYIERIVNHFFDDYGGVKADVDDFEKFYELPVAYTGGDSTEEYEKIYNDDSVITDKNAFDKEYMEYTLKDYSLDELIETAIKFAPQNEYEKTANYICSPDSAGNPYDAVFNVSGIKFEVKAFQDVAIPNVHELSIKTGNKTIGKIYDLCGRADLAEALKDLENGKAMVTTNKGKINVITAVEAASKQIIKD